MNFLRLSILFFVTTICAISARSQTTTYPSGVAGCLARWDFNNNGTITTLPDVSGNSHNGTPYNLVTAPNFRNVVNKAMHFNGTSSYALVPHHTSLNPANITIVGVVKFDAFYQGTCQGNNIIYKGYSYTVAGNWAMYASDNDNNCGAFSSNTVNIDLANDGTGQPYTIPNNPINLAKWYFFAVVYDGNTVTRYQVLMDSSTHYSNITPISSSFSGVPLGTNTYDVRIGATQNGPFPYYVNGDMDEVALFNTTLTSAQIQSVYDYLWGGILIGSVNTTFCSGASFNLPYTLPDTDNFQNNNVFTAQISDANGSFANPITIGTLTSNVSGMIACTLPTSLPAGTGYRIRIKSSSMATTSPDNGQNISIGASTSVAVIIAASPSNMVWQGANVTFTANPSTTGTGIVYYWKKNGTLIPGADTTQPVHSAVAGVNFVTGDVFSVDRKVTDFICNNTDTVTSNTISMSVSLSFNEVSGGYSIGIHPNPNNGTFSLEGDAPGSSAVSITITNVMGQTIRHEEVTIPGPGFKKEIRLLDRTPGIYFLTVTSNGVRKTIRFSII